MNNNNNNNNNKSNTNKSNTYFSSSLANNSNSKFPLMSLTTTTVILGWIVMSICFILFDVSFPTLKPITKSQEEIIGNVFLILFFTLIVLGLCVVLLPNLKELKTLFQQISNVTIVFVFTVFVILFYTMTSSDTLDQFGWVINPLLLLIGCFAFYKSLSSNYVDKYNLSYERIKMVILLFCFLTIVITLYNVNPNDIVTRWFSGNSMLLTIILSVFAFLYLLVLLIIPEGNAAQQQSNFLNNFSPQNVTIMGLMAVFVIGMTILLTVNRETLSNNPTKFGAVTILILLASILLAAAVNTTTGTKSSSSSSTTLGLYKQALLGVFGVVMSGLLIFWLTSTIEQWSGSSSSLSGFVLNLLLICVVLGLVYKTIYVKSPVGNNEKNAFFSLLFNLIMYLPCLCSSLFDKIGTLTTGQESAGSWLMLAVAIMLMVAYFQAPKVVDMINAQGGTQLVGQPIYTDSVHNLGSYVDLNGGSDTFDYQYAISCWIYLDAAPPNSNANAAKYTSLLNFGNKPNILYNASKNTLMVTMEQKGHTKDALRDIDANGNRVLLTYPNVLLQKWNNLVINYNGGTLDIFLNGELIKSSIEVVPYFTLDNLTVGENEGIKGGMCNVLYFKRPLTSSQLYYLYHMVKSHSPPLLNI